MAAASCEMYKAIQSNAEEATEQVLDEVMAAAMDVTFHTSVYLGRGPFGEPRYEYDWGRERNLTTPY